MSLSDRRVLCVRRGPGEDLCSGGPWVRSGSNVLRDLFRGGHWAWRPKTETEDDPAWRQVIPVLVLQRAADGAIFTARRLDDATESRLAGLWTVTIGGHVDWPIDDGSCPIEIDRSGPEAASHWRRAYDAIRACLIREYREETAVIRGTPYPRTLADLDLRLAGVIHSDLTAVDRAHLGIVHVGTVPEGWDLTHGEEFAESRWYDPVRDAEPDGLESWSRIVLSAMEGIGTTTETA